MAGTRARRPSTSDAPEAAGERPDEWPLPCPFGLRRFVAGGAAAVLAVGATACGAPEPDFDTSDGLAAEAIIGGTLVEDGDFPAVVSLGGCSGTLVHPSLVVYAEHCGTAVSEIRFGPRAGAPERVVSTERCRGVPGAKLGNGTDLAYCVLETPVLDIAPERIASGCELSDVEHGSEVILVGYGVDREGGVYGEKRVASARVDRVDRELILEPGSADTCRGDSGGPVFVERIEPDGTLQRRVIGVTSSGTEAECGRGNGHYVFLGEKLDWLEESSQLDLSPCFERGGWSPTAACVATVADGETEPARGEDGASAARLRSCGEPFALPEDERAPHLSWTSPTADGFEQHLPPEAAYAELEIAVDATDAEWGVQRVSFLLRDRSGRTLFTRDDEVPPYGLPLLRIPPGRFRLDAEATDFAGNRSTASVALAVHEETASSFYLAGGCSAARRRTGASVWPALFVWLLSSWRIRSGRTRPSGSTRR